MHYLHAAHGQGVWRVKALKPRLSYGEVANAMRPKILKNRPALVAKLKSLGATNLSSLDKKQYGEFKKFIDALP